MRTGSTICAALILTGIAFADNVSVTGKIIDSFANSGIAGAAVHISGWAQGKGFDSDVSGDVEGEFRTELPVGGRFMIQPKRAGYSPVGEVTTLETRPGLPALTLIVKMGRNGAISGRVVDWETGKPLANVKAGARQVVYFHGRREMQLWAGVAETNSDGAFVIGDIAPGDYVLDLNWVPSGREGYPRTFWPGPGDSESASIVPLPSGATLNAGTLRLRKGDLPSLVVKVTGGQCKPGQVYDVELQEATDHVVMTFARLQVPCGGAARLPHVNAGEYMLVAQATWEPRESRQMGAAPITIRDRDLEVSVPVTPPIVVSGRIFPDIPGAEADAKPGLPGSLRVELWPRGSKATAVIAPIASADATKAAADGTFRSWAYVPPGGEILTSVPGLPRNFYIKELRYNGAARPGDAFVLNPHAVQQQLDIVLSDKAGAVTGTVRTEDGKAVVNAAILLTPWPAEVFSTYPADATETVTDAAGSFEFQGLRPGTYRAVAVDAAQRFLVERPGVLLGLFDGAESVEVREQGTATANLTPRNPR